jgi:hypothetical protein
LLWEMTHRAVMACEQAVVGVEVTARAGGVNARHGVEQQRSTTCNVPGARRLMQCARKRGGPVGS